MPRAYVEYVQLAAALEQVTQAALPGRPVEDVLPAHRLPGQVTAITGQGFTLAGELLFPDEERLAGLDPLVMGYHRVLGRHRTSRAIVQ
jgi:hypothetical protein